MMSPFMKQSRNSSSEDLQNVPGKSSNAVPELSAAEEQNDITNKIGKDEEIEDVVWTEDDTSDIMDLMETALNNVKMKLLSKLKRKSTQPEQVDVVKKEEMEVERLEDLISTAQDSTLNVVEEINSVMQIIAEVTVDSADVDKEVSEEIPDITPSDTRVGKILADEQDNKAQENWQRLVRKLATKRKKSIRWKSKRSQMNDNVPDDKACMNPQVPDNDDTSEVDAVDNDEEDCIPDDWKPDFIPPSFNNKRQLNKFNQPDVVPVDVDNNLGDEDDDDNDEAAPPPYTVTIRRQNTLPLTRRSENRSVRKSDSQANIKHFPFQEIPAETNTGDEETVLGWRFAGGHGGGGHLLQ